MSADTIWFVLGVAVWLSAVWMLRRAAIHDRRAARVYRQAAATFRDSADLFYASADVAAAADERSRGQSEQGARQ